MGHFWGTVSTEERAGHDLPPSVRKVSENKFWNWQWESFFSIFVE